MLGNNLAIGTKLNVNFMRDAKEQYIISFVYDYYEDNGLFIPVTIRDIAEYRFIVGEAIFIVINTGSGLLRWEGELKGITKIRGKLMLCVVLHNINPEVINRREAYRVSCEESIKLNVEGKEYMATLRDVSFLEAGIDVRYYANPNYSPGTMFSIQNILLGELREAEKAYDEDDEEDEY